jgi:hypothetical protein
MVPIEAFAKGQGSRKPVRRFARASSVVPRTKKINQPAGWYIGTMSEHIDVPSAAFGRKQRLNGPRIARIPRMWDDDHQFPPGGRLSNVVGTRRVP